MILFRAAMPRKQVGSRTRRFPSAGESGTISRMADATAEISSRSELFRLLWRPAGCAYLFVSLAALAAGLWPKTVVPLGCLAAISVPPTLQTLAAGQSLFFLLAYPLILAQRAEKRNFAGRNFVGISLLETAGMFLAAGPLAFLAAWLGDAAPRDVVRAMLAVAAVCPVGIGGGHLLARPRWRSAVLTVLLAISLGLPGAAYLAEDFVLADGSWEALREISPLLYIWRSAAVRQSVWLPHPTWAWLSWPTFSAAGGLLLGFLRLDRPTRQEL